MADELELSLGDLDARFADSFAAANYLESIRWPNGPVCPHCGESERKPYRLKNQTRKLWKCAACRKQFTVTIGTIFERSHIPLHKWMLAFYLLCSSKKGMSAHQLHRMLGVSYEIAKGANRATGRGTKKTPVVVLVERGGHARSFRMTTVTGAELSDAMRKHI